MTKTAVVGGAGGFIGGHLVKKLLDGGYEVRAADWKSAEDWWQRHDIKNYDRTNLGDAYLAKSFTLGADEVYNLAADMGGMGFITQNKLDCMMSVRSSTEMLRGALNAGARYFYSSSACVYAEEHQTGQAIALSEDMAYPAMPEDGYGWEKLFSERMCRHAHEDASLETRVARYHNVYGPNGTWTGGREKAPAALCRKIAEASISGATSIDVWGDGKAQRTFMYVDDCVEGTLRIMRGDYIDPVNLGSETVVTINELAHIIMTFAGETFAIKHVPGPQGVRGRASDNGMIRERYGWEPEIGLYEGLEKTYAWIFDQVAKEYGA